MGSCCGKVKAPPSVQSSGAQEQRNREWVQRHQAAFHQECCKFHPSAFVSAVTYYNALSQFCHFVLGRKHTDSAAKRPGESFHAEPFHLAT